MDSLIAAWRHRPESGSRKRRAPSPPLLAPLVTDTQPQRQRTGASHQQASFSLQPDISPAAQGPLSVRCSEISGNGPTSADVLADPNSAVLLQHGSANNKTVGGYWAKFKHLQEFCEKNAWDPLIFSLELAVLFACAMMNRIWGGNYIQDVDDYFSAFNHVYGYHSLGRPWAGGAMTSLRKAFRKAQVARSGAAGMAPGSLRIGVPFSLIVAMLSASERAVDTDLAFYGLFWLMLLFMFRADTMGGILSADSDIRFLEDGSLNFMVRRLKRGTAHLQPFTRSIPAPPPTNTFRTRVFEVIRRAVALRNPQAPTEPLIRAGFLGTTPARASDALTNAMDRLLSANLSESFMMGDGSHISSHSWRKAAASALAAMQANWLTIKMWGMWASANSAERYIDALYADHPMARMLFDWLLTVGGHAHTVPVAAQYSEADEADDGVTDSPRAPHGATQ